MEPNISVPGKQAGKQSDPEHTAYCCFTQTGTPHTHLDTHTWTHLNTPLVPLILVLEMF